MFRSGSASAARPVHTAAILVVAVVAFRGEEVRDAQPDISRWLQGIGLLA